MGDDGNSKSLCAFLFSVSPSHDPMVGWPVDPMVDRSDGHLLLFPGSPKDMISNLNRGCWISFLALGSIIDHRSSDRIFFAFDFGWLLGAA